MHAEDVYDVVKQQGEVNRGSWVDPEKERRCSRDPTQDDDENLRALAERSDL